MVRPTVYLLDSSVFIEANKNSLAFDINPGFWDLILHHCENGHVASIDRVYNELRKKDDDVAAWVKDAPGSLFQPTTTREVVTTLSEIMDWVNRHELYSPADKARFARGADGWLIAYARLHHYVVVTEEGLAGDNTRKVKIPNVCRNFDVRCIKTVAMLRDLGVRFSWR